MSENPSGLRQAYGFIDYLYYTASGLVPLLTGAVAIYPRSTLGLVLFVLIVLAGATAVLFFFCAHCPHYRKADRTLRCIFFWGMPKFFAPQPGPLNWVGKIAALGAALAVFFFPMAWLAEDPGLLAIYLLSTAVFLATVRRCECHRCTFFACPANKVPDEARRAD
jgi:hypothetical protein